MLIAKELVHMFAEHVGSDCFSSESGNVVSKVRQEDVQTADRAFKVEQEVGSLCDSRSASSQAKKKMRTVVRYSSCMVICQSIIANDKRTYRTRHQDLPDFQIQCEVSDLFWLSA